MRVFLFSLLLLSIRTYADKAVDGGNSSFTPTSKAVQTCDCQCQYKKNGCSEVKNKLPDKQKDFVLTCGQSTGTPDLNDNWAAGCFHGIFDGSVMAIVDGATGTYKLISDDAKCNKDPEAKLMLLRTVSHTYSTEMLKVMINKWDCGSIANEVRNKQNSIYNSIARKTDEFQNKLASRGIDLSSENLEVESHAALSDNERKFLDNMGPKDDPIRALKKEFGNVWNCYTPYARLRLACDKATKAVTLLAGAVGVVGRASAVEGAAETAQMTKAIDLGKKGTRFDWLTDGSWIERHHPNIPSELKMKLTKLPEHYQLYGTEIKYRSPVLGVESLTVFENAGQSHYSMFLGWGSTNAAREKVISAAKEAGLQVNVSESFHDGFIGTANPDAMLKFLQLAGQ